MRLTDTDAKLFFDLMWSLQHYVNDELKILPDVKSPAIYSKKYDLKEKIKVREELFSNPQLIASFIQKNPHKLSKDKLEIINNWQNFIKGKFFIERFLKKHTIFIKENDVYTVSGLYQGFDEFVHPANLPVYVETILLPFKGKIIYDGVLMPHKILFGNGYKRDLKEVYMEAKKNNRIISNI